MKCAVVTLALGSQIKRMLKLSGPFFKAYSKKVGAQYVVIEEHSVNGFATHLEKFQMHDMLNTYDRILYLDADIIIQELTPNLFDIVPFDKVGVVFDNPTNNESDNNRKKEIVAVQKALGQVGWTQGYANSGVLLFSNVHKGIFANPELRYKFTSGFKDQTLINYNLHKHGYHWFKLDKRFNGMEINGYSSRNINPKTKLSGKNKQEAFCMHFANEGTKIIQMYDTVLRTKIENKILRDHVLKNLEEMKAYISAQRLRERRRDSNPPLPVNNDVIKNPKDIMLFYDISELGWAMYLAAHLKYLKRLGQKVGIITQKSREVLYRDCADVIFPFPKEFIQRYGGLPSDGNHLFDPRTNERLKDHNQLSRPFRRAFPKFNVITRYSKFEDQRIFEPYSHSLTSEAFCSNIFGDSQVIMIFPRHRTSKFQCRNISKDIWEKIIYLLLKTFPNCKIASIGSTDGAHNIKMKHPNYHNLVEHNNDETLDIMIALSNTNQAVLAIGNQSGTVKITLLCGTPTYIIGDEKQRHTIDENWTGTEVGFWKTNSTSSGYDVRDASLMIDDILSFAKNNISSHNQRIIENISKQQPRRYTTRAIPTSKFKSGVNADLVIRGNY